MKKYFGFIELKRLRFIVGGYRLGLHRDYDEEDFSFVIILIQNMLYC